jgi:CRISPR-associated protein Cas5t
MHEARAVSLLVTVPVCSFRKGFAREYLETEMVPPPSTVYGFLLSLIGEEDRRKYVGSHIAYAMLGKPELSVVLRTVWRIKDNKTPPGIGSNRRPDYQEVLTGLRLALWIRAGNLADSVKSARNKSDQVIRYGGLSLGESRDLVNDINYSPEYRGGVGYWLMPDRNGELALPVWVDHVGSKGTVWQQFSLKEGPLEVPGLDDFRWIGVRDK